MARHRPEAARGGARVPGCADPPLRRARAHEEADAVSARPFDRPRSRPRPDDRLDDRADDRVVRRGNAAGARGSAGLALVIRAVLFDVDFTLARPGPELMPEGYVGCAERHGLALDAARYAEAREAAFVELQHHPELDHDEEIWIAFTERIVLGMGGAAPASRAVAEELTAR